MRAAVSKSGTVVGAVSKTYGSFHATTGKPLDKWESELQDSR